MIKKAITLVMTFLVFAALLNQSFSNIGLIKAAPATLRVPLDYPAIQAAINAANASDTISVAPGVYLERVVVNKTVKLVGDDKHTTIIDGSGTGIALRIMTNDAGVSNFTVRNAAYGIYLDSSSGSTVSDNILANHTNSGIYLSQSGFNTFARNIVLRNSYGFAISLQGSRGNILRNNNMTGNSQNFKLFTTLVLSDFIQDIDSSNTVDGKPVYYWMNQSDKQVLSDAGYVAIINSTNITIKDIVTTKNGEGILLAYTNNSVIDNLNASNSKGLAANGIALHYSNNNYILRSLVSNNTGAGVELTLSNDNVILGTKVINNSNGIVLLECTNNLIYGNTISGNKAQGIYIANSGNNTIHHNSFVDNVLQLFTQLSTNTFDDGYPSGGNYWSNYADVDLNSGPYQNITGSDDIWDHPYIIDANNTDRYPLKNLPPPVPAFVMSVSPFYRAVEPGESVTYVVSVFSVNNFSSEVRLNGTMNPSTNEISLAFNPSAVTPLLNGSVQSTLNVTAVSDAVPASYIITVNATYADLYTTDTVDVEVLDILKPFVDAGPDQTVDEGTIVTFDGSESYDNIGIVDYTWTFFDVGPQILTGVSPAYLFENAGSFVVTLNVTDAAGNWDIDSVSITVRDITPPLADAGADKTTQVGVLVTFDGDNSNDNVGVVSYKWDFGDGSNGTGAQATHTYSIVGTFNVTLTVRDLVGNSDTDTVTVTVTAAPDSGFLFLILAAGGGIAIVGIVSGALFWRKRKRQLTEQMPAPTHKKV